MTFNEWIALNAIVMACLGLVLASLLIIRASARAGQRRRRDP